LVLRVGLEGFSPKPIGCWWIARAVLVERVGHRVLAERWTGNDPFEGLPRALNNRLRARTDKENPTI